MITIVKMPQKFTPSDDAIIFQVQSSFANVVYFQVEITEATTGAVISELELYATPSYPNGSYIDLSKILSSTVTHEINNSQTAICVSLSKPITAYRIAITERGVVAGFMVDLSPQLILTDTFYVFNAGIGRFKFNSYIYSKQVITNGLPAKFLTYKPNSPVLNDKSSEQLYFIQDGQTGLDLIVKTYSAANALLNTYTYSIDGLDEKQMFRLQVSPKTLKNTLTVDFTNVAFYTVWIEKDGQLKTETKKYFYQKSSCGIHPQNLFWVNSLGGIDTYQFVNTTEQNSITKNNIKKNPYRVNSNLYSDRVDDILNPTEEIIDVTQLGTYTSYSQFLSDAESEWLNELFTSKNVWAELYDNSLVPVTVTNTSYNIQKQYQNKQGYNSTQVTYTVSGSIIPSVEALATAFFYNVAMAVAFTKNDCGTGFAGSTVTYNVPAGKYISDISQELADEAATNEITANGQAYANLYGTCISTVLYGNEVQSGAFTKACRAGYTGTTVVYTVAADTYHASSLAAANALATEDIAHNGQSYANANGVCNVSAINNRVTAEVGIDGSGLKIKVICSTETNTDIDVTCQVYDSSTFSEVGSGITVTVLNGDSVAIKNIVHDITHPPYYVVITAITPSSYSGMSYTF